MGLGCETKLNSPHKQSRALSIAEYDSASARVDQLPADALTPVRLGLFGEVGSLMATSKKLHREGHAYAAYSQAVVEEFGDTLWYLASLCRRLGYKLEDIIGDASDGEDVSSELVTSTVPTGPLACVKSFTNHSNLDELLLTLGRDAAALLNPCSEASLQREQLIRFSRTYLMAVQACGIPFSTITQTNIDKTNGRFLKPDFEGLPVFDAEFPDEEQLPTEFRIEIKQRANGKSYLRWNGVFIGAPLTDNIGDPDGYRFHDVFHLAHAAILHWSPTFRALISQKRKSDAELDENEDGGRAIVIEEGLTAYIFSCAKYLEFFEGQSSVSFDLLKTINKFVRGYEVEQCPLWLWEKAILDGYKVFRQVVANNGGTVIGDRDTRTISYEPNQE